MTDEDVDSFALYLNMDNTALMNLRRKWPSIVQHGFKLLKNWQNAAHEKATCKTLLDIIKIKGCCSGQ